MNNPTQKEENMSDNDTIEMPDEIWAYETNCKNSKGFGHWYDEDISGKRQEDKATHYIRADRQAPRVDVETLKKQVHEAFTREAYSKDTEEDIKELLEKEEYPYQYGGDIAVEWAIDHLAAQGRLTTPAQSVDVVVEAESLIHVIFEAYNTGEPEHLWNVVEKYVVDGEQPPHPTPEDRKQDDFAQAYNEGRLTVRNELTGNMDVVPLGED